MIYLIGSQKGGSGKSTIATNVAVGLASRGRDVLLLDADNQKTSSRWASRRNELASVESQVHCVERSGDNIRSAVADLADRYEDIVIDTAGHDGVEFRSGMTVAHKVFVPLRPSQADLETTANVDEILNAVRAMRLDEGPECYALLSMTPTHYMNTEIQEAADYIKEFTSMLMASSKIFDRKVYRDAMLEGRGALEMKNPSAIKEINGLLDEVQA